MKVAIAGTGNVAQYLMEEFKAAGHEIVVLTRSIKPDLKAYEQRQTDYSIPSLISVLEDRDGLVSTVADFLNPSAGTQVHLNMLEALKQSKQCKTFIPSEWTANVEDYPEQPMMLTEANKTLHSALKQAANIRWTIISNSWFADYILPASQRHLRDIGELWPGDHATKTFTIYGPGDQHINFVSVRDVAKAVAVLLDSEEPWEEYTYVSGEQLTWNELFAIIKKSDPEWKSKNKPLADTIRQIVANESPASVSVAYFEILGYSGASAFPEDRVQRQRAKYFPNLHFRTIREILATAAANPDQVV